MVTFLRIQKKFKHNLDAEILLDKNFLFVDEKFIKTVFLT